MDILSQPTSQSIYVPYLATNYKTTDTNENQIVQSQIISNIPKDDILAQSAGVFKQQNFGNVTPIQTTAEAYPVTNYSNTNIPTTTNEEFPLDIIGDATNSYQTIPEAYPTTDYSNINFTTSTEAYPTTNLAENIQTTDYIDTVPTTSYTEAYPVTNYDTNIDLPTEIPIPSTSYQTTDSLDYLPQNYDLGFHEDYSQPKYETSTAPLMTPQYNRAYRHITLTSSRFIPRYLPSFTTNVPVTKMVPFPKVPAPVPVPAPIAPQPLEMTQVIPTQNQEPIPIAPIAPIAPVQQVEQPVSQPQFTFSQESFIPQNDEHYIRNYPIYENDPRRQMLRSVLNNSALNTGVPGASVDQNLITNTLSGVDSSIPKVNENIPNINANIPNLNANIPNVNANIPNLNANLPNVNTNLPNLNANLPNLKTIIRKQ